MHQKDRERPGLTSIHTWEKRDRIKVFGSLDGMNGGRVNRKS
jgi:hypothetical protein